MLLACEPDWGALLPAVCGGRGFSLDMPGGCSWCLGAAGEGVSVGCMNSSSCSMMSLVPGHLQVTETEVKNSKIERLI